MRYTPTRPGMVFCSVRNDVLTQVVVKIAPCRLVKGYGHFGGTLGLKIMMNGETSQMIWIFTNTAVRISPPLTVVPKRRQETTNRYVKSQTSINLIRAAFVAETTQLWKSAISKVFCCAVHMYASHFQIQQVKDKMKWAELHHLLRLFVMWWTEFELQCMPSELSDSDEV